jgi:hypothetical protein
MSLTREDDYKLRGIKSGDVQRKPIEERIKELEEIYGKKFTYDFTNYKKSSSKIGIICPKHGRDDVHLISLMKGRGCKQCKYETTKKYQHNSIPVEIRNKNRINNVKKANKKRRISHDKIYEFLTNKFPNFVFEILDGCNGVETIIRIECSKHGVSYNKYEYLKDNKYACVNCSKSIVSYDETVWLNENGVKDRQFKIYNFKVDGYDSKTNTVYEYLGQYWHGHPNMKIRHNNFNKRVGKTMDQLFEETQERFTKLNSLGYDVIYRWENEEIDLKFNGILKTSK